MADVQCNCAAHGSGVFLEHWPTCAWVLGIERDRRRLATAMVLAMHRRIDLDDTERFGDDGTRHGYWLSLGPATRELMLLRADAVIAAQDDYSTPPVDRSGSGQVEP